MAGSTPIRSLAGLAQMITQVGQRVHPKRSDVIAGVDPTRNFPTAGQPIPAMGPPGSQALAFPYIFSQNQTFTPRFDSQYSAADLRMLGTYPLARICAENVKNQICQTKWDIHLKPVPGEEDKDRNKREKKDPTITKLARFLERPNTREDWSELTRRIVEDMLTVDAPALLTRRTIGGKQQIAELRAIPGDSITCYIDDNGWVPEPPSPAYTQLWSGGGIPAGGYPRVNLSTRELVYKPRNIVPRNTASSFLYGFGPCEQLAQEIEIGIARLVFIKSYYEKGSIPDAIHVIPPDVNPDKIKEAMEIMASELAGDLARRRQMYFTQGFNKDGKPDQFIFPKEPLLTDPFDDLHIRKVAFGYGCSPQRLQRAMNRACYSSDTETLTENGWKLFDNIYDGEKVAQFNPATNGIELVVPEEKFVFPYSGKMFHFKTQNVDVMVTPEHNMWLSKKCEPRHSNSFWKPYEKQPAEKAKTPFRFLASATYCGDEKEYFTIPDVRSKWSKLTRDDMQNIRSSPESASVLAGEYQVHQATIDRVRKTEYKQAAIIEGATVLMDDWLEFLGYYLSEGGLSHLDKHYMLTLAQKDASKTEKIENCLKRLPFHFKRYPEQADGMNRWNVNGKPLCTYLMENAGGYCHDKRIPRDFLSLSLRQLVILFDALMLGDGEWDKRNGRNSGKYMTTSKRLCDDVQELAFKLGYCVSVSYRDDKRGNRKRLYTIQVCDRKEHMLATRSTITQEDYDGPVYCLTVPSGLFVTRRNGKIAIQGNSAQAGQEASEEEGLLPFQNWLGSFFNFVLQCEMGYIDYELTFDPVRGLDAQKQAEIDKIYAESMIRPRNEIRADHGWDSIDIPEMSEPGQSGANGFMPITLHGPVTEPAANGNIPTDQNGKALRVVPRESNNGTLGERIGKYIKTEGHRICEERRDHIIVNTVRKDKSTDRDRERHLLEALLAIEWSELGIDVTPEYETIAEEVVIQSLSDLGVSSTAVVNAAREAARAFASSRAAELVGMRYVDGSLVENPDARWAISETTRDAIRQLVSDAVANDTPLDELAAKIREATAFGAERAATIAQTEKQIATHYGNMEAWKASGMVEEVDWKLSPDHKDGENCDCEFIAAHSPYKIDQIPDFPRHPFEKCTVLPRIVSTNKAAYPAMRKASPKVVQAEYSLQHKIGKFLAKVGKDCSQKVLAFEAPVLVHHLNGHAATL